MNKKQMHLDLENPPKIEEIAENIKRLNELGLEVQITEMDVRIKSPASKKDLKKQAELYRNILKVCLEARNCTAFVLWGFTDRYSWIPDYFNKKNGYDANYSGGLIFDESFRPKPAYHAIKKYLLQ